MHARTALFVVGALLGVVIGYETSYASEIAIAVFALGTVQGLLLAVERKRDIRGVALSFYTLLVATGIAVGIIRVQLVEEKSPYVCESACTLDASIVTSPKIKDAYQTFIIRPVDNGGEMYDIQVRAPLYPRYSIGEQVRITGEVKLPGLIFPHGDEKGFDYAAYLFTKHIGSEMVFPKIESVDKNPSTLVSMLGRWKEEMISNIHMYVSAPASSLASGMLFGNSSMSEELTQMFRVAGLSHIIVLSGFNIAIVIAFILFAFSFLPLTVRVGLASFFVIVFVIMVGGEASVIRATAMAGLGLLAMVAGRSYVARQALIISLFFIVMYEPYSLLHNVSLHLSFLATAGIVYLSDAIKRGVSRYQMPIFMRELIVTTAAAYVATLPYVCYMFGTVSVYALFANILVLPFVPLAMLVSFLVVVCGFFSGSAALIVGYVDTLLIRWIMFVAETINVLPGSSVSVTLSLTTICALYVGIVCVFLYVSRKKNDETFQTSDAPHLTDVLRY